MREKWEGYKWEANAGIVEPVLDFILLPVLWWENGTGAG
jgi:hypothetical protein